MQVRNKQSSSVQVEGGAALTLGGDPYGEGGTRASGANSCSACAYVGAGTCVQTHRAAQVHFHVCVTPKFLNTNRPRGTGHVPRHRAAAS